MGFLPQTLCIPHTNSCYDKHGCLIVRSQLKERIPQIEGRVAESFNGKLEEGFVRKKNYSLNFTFKQ